MWFSILADVRNQIQSIDIQLRDADEKRNLLDNGDCFFLAPISN